MSNLENCLKQLQEIFRKRIGKFELPGIDIYELIKAILEKVAERLCQEVLSDLKREEQEWVSLWQTLINYRPYNNSQWSQIQRQTSLGNQTLSSTVTKRLKAILR